MALQPLVGQGLRISGYAITPRPATVGKTLYVWSALRRDNTQRSQETDIHAPGGIQTHDPSKPAAADPPLRPRGHWDRLNPSNTQSYYVQCNWNYWVCGTDFILTNFAGTCRQYIPVNKDNFILYLLTFTGQTGRARPVISNTVNVEIRI
jgi:hypothetical protein